MGSGGYCEPGPRGEYVRFEELHPRVESDGRGFAEGQAVHIVGLPAVQYQVISSGMPPATQHGDFVPLRRVDNGQTLAVRAGNLVRDSLIVEPESSFEDDTDPVKYVHFVPVEDDDDLW